MTAPTKPKPSLLIHGIGQLVTMDAARRRLTDAWVRIVDGVIAGIGTGPMQPRAGEASLDARGGIALPGLVNTHHHMQQNLARAYPPVADLPLLPWVGKMNLLWEELTPEDVQLATEVAMAELMLSGCTTPSVLWASVVKSSPVPGPEKEGVTAGFH